MTTNRPLSESAASRVVAHDRRLRLFVRHLLGRGLRTVADVDDIVQEVYLRACAAAQPAPDTEEPDAVPWPWLATIARHVVVDVARAARAAKRGGRVERLARSDWSRGGVDPQALTAGPHTRLVGVETEARLVRAFDDLPAEHRRVLGFRQFEGLSARETAARMGRSETAVHSLYRRALMAWDAAVRGGGDLEP